MDKEDTQIMKVCIMGNQKMITVPKSRRDIKPGDYVSIKKVEFK